MGDQVSVLTRLLGLAITFIYSSIVQPSEFI